MFRSQCSSQFGYCFFIFFFKRNQKNAGQCTRSIGWIVQKFNRHANFRFSLVLDEAKNERINVHPFIEIKSVRRVKDTRLIISIINTLHLSQ